MSPAFERVLTVSQAIGLHDVCARNTAGHGDIPLFEPAVGQFCRLSVDPRVLLWATCHRATVGALRAPSHLCYL
jgi:hypothetical protein